MNNQNYNQQPQQQPQPTQQPMYQQPAPPAPQPPKAPKAPIFNNDLLGLIGCTASFLGFGMIIASVSIYPPAYGLILNILAFLFSAGGCVLSYFVGNARVKSGAPRGTVATLGIIFGLAAFVLCLFFIFSNGCYTCAACKAKTAFGI